MFLQIHFLTSYHATLLNRDDAGLAKRINFGGTPRLRVSSQCQKRHWRKWLTDNTDLPNGIRSRHFFSRELKDRLNAAGMNKDNAHALIFHLAGKILTSAKQKKDPIDKETLMMKQPVLFGRPEADYFERLILEANRQANNNVEDAKKFLDKEFELKKKNFKAMLRQAGAFEPASGFEGALFGRFVTSEILTRVDAPVHVAHSFTTHALDTEVDFFTVIDDLAEDEETGAAHANDMELGAGIFYGYVAVDTALLVSNLTGCEQKAWRQQDFEDAHCLLGSLIHAVAMITPGAKLGATAPYARAGCVVLEAGKSQPRSLANAFLQPVRLGLHGAHPMVQSIESLGRHLDALERMYGDTGEQRFISSLYDWPRNCNNEKVSSLPDAVKQSLDCLFGEQRP